MPSLDDLFQEEKPTRQNIVVDADFDNVDPVTKEYATGLLDYAYKTYGYNAPITSGYRDPERNAAVGGVPNSWHIQGKAVDLDLSGLSPEQIADIEAKAREKFGEVLYHDVGSGLHLHAANPIQQPSILDNVAGLFKPSVAEASPAPQPMTLDALFDEKQPQTSAPARLSLDALFDEKPTTPQQPVDTTIPDAFNAGIYGTTDVKDGSFIDAAGKAIGSPLGALIEATSVLNKPVSALAGAWTELQTQTGYNPLDVLNPVAAYNRPREGTGFDVGKIAEKTVEGWKSNEKTLADLAFTKQQAEEYPLAYLGVGLVFDAAGDPLRVATPAKVVSGASKILKRIGATDKVADIARIVSESKGGKVALETVNKVLDYEVKGIPLKRWFQEEGLLGKEMTEEARREASLTRRISDQMEINKKAEQELIKQGVSPDEAKEIVARGVQARPTVATQLTPEEIIDAYINKTLDQLIIDGKVDATDAINVLKSAGEKIPRKYLSQNQIDEIANLTREGKETKRAMREEIDPYGVSIEEKSPRQQILEESKRINAETRKTIDEVMTTRGITREQVLAELDGLGITPEVATQVRLAVTDTAALMDEMAQLGYQAGMLTDKDMIRFFGGSHLRRSYGMFDNADDWLKTLEKVGTPEEIKKATLAKQLAESRQAAQGRVGLNLNALIERVPLSKETREKMGQITNTEYLVGKTGQTNVPLFSQAKFYEDVKNRFAVSPEIAEGNKAYKMIPDSTPDKAGRKAFGSLSGQWVPAEVFGEVMAAAQKFQRNPNGLQKAVSTWKIGKLLNPATYARNIQSGAIAMNTFGKVPMVEVLPTMAEATREMMKRGNFYKEARDAGLFHGGITQAELKGALGEGTIASRGLDKLMNLYGKSDDFYRMATYLYHRKAGASVEDAVNLADRALFNYSKVPPLLDALRKNGFIPFGAYPYFAAKETVRTLYQDPASITKYMRAQWQNEGTEEKSVMPDYLKTHTLMRLGKGEREVRGEKQPITSFLDMTYLLPFMNDFSFGPALDIVDAMRGKDYLGRDLTPAPEYATFGEKALDRGAAVYNILAPTLATKQYWDKPYRAATGTMDDKGRTYTPKEAAAQALLGWKTVNVNVDEEYVKRMQGLQANYMKTGSDLSRLLRAPNPDEKEIQQRREQLLNIVKEMQTVGKNLDKAQKKK